MALPYPSEILADDTAEVDAAYRDLTSTPSPILWDWINRLRGEMLHRSQTQAIRARALSRAVTDADSAGIESEAAELADHAQWFEWASDLMDDLLFEVSNRVHHVAPLLNPFPVVPFPLPVAQPMPVMQSEPAPEPSPAPLTDEPAPEFMID